MQIPFPLQQATQQNKNIMFLYITLILTLITNPVHPSPFPDQMLHSNEENTVLNNLHTLGYETTRNPRQQQVSRQIPLHTLMPRACDLSKIDSVTKSTQYGLVGFQVFHLVGFQTYTQQYFAQGRYSNSIQEFDQHCTCPFTRQIIWNPESNWTTLKSGEILHINNRIEVVKFRKRRYNIQNDYIKNPQESIRINAIESIYMQDLSIIPHMIAGFYETFSWVKWKLDVTHFSGKNDPIVSTNTSVRIKAMSNRHTKTFNVF